MKNKMIHSRNVANFEILISYLFEIEENYQHMDKKIDLKYLQELLKRAENSLKLVKYYKVIYENFYHSINIQLYDIKELNNKHIQEIENSNISYEILNDAKSLNNYIQNETIKNISDIDQYSFTKTDYNRIIFKQQFFMLIENICKIIEEHKVNNHYFKNKNNLMLSEMNNKLDILKNLNNSLLDASINYLNSINNRNAILYSSNTGLVSNAIEIKLFIKNSSFLSNKIYKKIKKIKFNKIK